MIWCALYVWWEDYNRPALGPTGYTDHLRIISSSNTDLEYIVCSIYSEMDYRYKMVYLFKEAL